MRFLAFLWPTLAVLNRNVFAALRLSVLPVLAAVGVWVAARSYAPLIGGSALHMMAYLLAVLFALCLCYAWFAIRWHRFLLRKETQSALGGSFPPRTLRRYTLRLFALVAAILVASFLIAVITDPGGEMGLPAQWLRYFMVYMASGWVFYRLSPALAGVPLAQPLTRIEAWRATRGTDFACLGITFGTFLLTTLLQIPMTPEGADITPLEPLYITVSFWVQVLVFTTSVSVVYHATVMAPRPCGE